MRYSDNLSNIAAALAKAQAEIRNPIKNNVNKGVQGSPKYANLEDTLAEYVRPILAKHGMSVFQPIKSEGDKVGVCTVLFHESGEFIEGDYVFCPVEIPLSSKGNKILTQGQATGVNITYLRRYSLNAALAINGDKDTDGSYTDSPLDQNVQIFPMVTAVLTYEQSLNMVYNGKALRDIYKTDRKAIQDIYNDVNTPVEVKEAIKVIEAEIKKANQAQ
jgi:hypothetical protein